MNTCRCCGRDDAGFLRSVCDACTNVLSSGEAHQAVSRRKVALESGSARSVATGLTGEQAARCAEHRRTR